MDGTLINGFNRIQAVSNRHKQRGYNVEVHAVARQGRDLVGAGARRPPAGRRGRRPRPGRSMPRP